MELDGKIAIITGGASGLGKAIATRLAEDALVEQNFDIIEKINQEGTTIFMVEQNANMALSIADRGYVLQTGHIVLADTAEGLLSDEMMHKAYLGR